MIAKDFGVEIMLLPHMRGNGFVAIVPDLPGCRSDGDMPHEALSNAYDAIAPWLVATEEFGRDVPPPRRIAD